MQSNSDILAPFCIGFIVFSYRHIEIFDLQKPKNGITFAITEGEKEMKNTLKTNIIIDLAMFLSMVVVSISGIVIKIIAPLRKFAQEEWVRELAKSLVVGGRQLWKDIHLWSGVVLLVLLVVHIVLHWRVIDSFFSKHIRSGALRKTLYGVLLLLLLLSVVPWIWAI